MLVFATITARDIVKNMTIIRGQAIASRGPCWY